MTKTPAEQETSQGARRPNLDRVRSDSAPPTGLKTSANAALTPATTPSAAILCARSMRSIWSGSKMVPTPAYTADNAPPATPKLTSRRLNPARPRTPAAACATFASAIDCAWSADRDGGPETDIVDAVRGLDHVLARDGGPAIGPDLPRPLGQLDGDGRQLARPRSHPGETGEPATRAARVGPPDWADINLHDLTAWPIAGVAHSNAHLVSVACFDPLIAPRCVAVPVAERVSRGDPMAVPRAVADKHALVVGKPAVGRRRAEDWAVGRDHRPGGRQAAAWLGLAEQDVGQRMAGLLTGEPGEENGCDIVRPRQFHR